MKKQLDLQLLMPLCGGILINYLFWMESLGLNLMLYSVFIIVILLFDTEVPKSQKMLTAGSLHLLAALLVVVNHSDLTIVTWFVTFAVFVGITHFESLRTIPAALVGALLQLATVPLNIIRKIKFTTNVSYTLRPYFKFLKYIIIPLLALVLFSTLYSIANSVIAGYMQNLAHFIIDASTRIFNFFFTELSFLRFLHILLGIVLSAAVFIGFKNKTLENIEAAQGDELQREKKKHRTFTLGYEILEVFAGDLLKRKMALKTENIIGIISFLALNLLILFLNILEVADLVAGNTTDSQLSSELHGGTYALIVSVIMAMLVILYFFSGNLNFYSRNQWIKRLAFIWIVQNALLVSLVLWRDLQYIGTFGLTYKRIGVMVFLLLCTIGLVSVYIKVAFHKTLFYLFRVNSLVWYVLLLSSCFINWDVFIANYNISNRLTIQLDPYHLLSLSDKALPVIDKNKALLQPYLPTIEDIVEKQPGDSTISARGRDVQFEDKLKRRIEVFKSKYKKSSSLSWNYRDWQTFNYLKE